MLSCFVYILLLCFTITYYNTKLGKLYDTPFKHNNVVYISSKDDILNKDDVLNIKENNFANSIITNNVFNYNTQTINILNKKYDTTIELDSNNCDNTLYVNSLRDYNVIKKHIPLQITMYNQNFTINKIKYNNFNQDNRLLLKLDDFEHLSVLKFFSLYEEIHLQILLSTKFDDTLIIDAYEFYDKNSSLKKYYEFKDGYFGHLRRLIPVIDNSLEGKQFAMERIITLDEYYAGSIDFYSFIKVHPKQNEYLGYRDISMDLKFNLSNYIDRNNDMYIDDYYKAEIYKNKYARTFTLTAQEYKFNFILSDAQQQISDNIKQYYQRNNIIPLFLSYDLAKEIVFDKLFADCTNTLELHFSDNASLRKELKKDKYQNYNISKNIPSLSNGNIIFYYSAYFINIIIISLGLLYIIYQTLNLNKLFKRFIKKSKV